VAFDPGTQWFVWSTGNANNGGGFNPSNTNFLTDLAATNAAGNSPVVTSASYNFVAGDAGAWIYIQAGTNWTPGWYEIASVAANAATLKAAVGEATKSTNREGTQVYYPTGANTVAGCATTGSPTGGTWSIDYSQQAAAGIAFTDLVIDAVTNTDFTSALNPLGKQMLGNILNVTSGTGFTVQRVEIVSIPSGVIARADKSMGTLGSTGGNGNLGGAVAILPTVAVSTVAVAGNRIWLKATATYTLTSTWTITAKGNVTNGPLKIEGYTTIPGARDGRPLITSATNSVALLTLNDADFLQLRHLHHTHTAATRGIGLVGVTALAAPVYLDDVLYDGCSSAISSTSVLSPTILIGCEIKNCTGHGLVIYASPTLIGCDIHDNTGAGIRWTGGLGSTLTAINTIIDTNGAIGIDTVIANVTGQLSLFNCIVVDNTSDGVKLYSNSSNFTLDLVNTIFYGNTGFGINNADTQPKLQATMRVFKHCAFGSNSSGARSSTLPPDPTEITLTADPFVDRAARNFALNNTAGGGALLRALGFPSVIGAIGVGATASYQDVGAAQHQDTGGSGGVNRALLPAGLSALG